MIVIAAIRINLIKEMKEIVSGIVEVKVTLIKFSLQLNNSKEVVKFKLKINN